MQSELNLKIVRKLHAWLRVILRLRAGFHLITLSKGQPDSVNSQTSTVKSPSGFTLIELITAAGIFSIAMLVATGLFAATTRTQKRVQSLSKVQADARFVVETMAQAVRVDGIDYSTLLDTGFFDTDSSYGIKLVTRDSSDNRTFYRQYLNGTRPVIGVCLRTAAQSADRCKSNSSTQLTDYSDITPVSVKITAFNVYIRPLSNPYKSPPSTAADCKNATAPVSDACTCSANSDCYTDQTCDATAGICLNANIQPRATIVVSSRGGSIREEEKQDETVQTTISSRQYKR